MQKKYKEKLKQVLDKTACDKEYRCYKSGPEPLCKPKDMLLEGFIEVDKGSTICDYLKNYGGRYFCKCPLYVHLETSRH